MDPQYQVFSHADVGGEESGNPMPCRAMPCHAMPWFLLQVADCVVGVDGQKRSGQIALTMSRDASSSSSVVVHHVIGDGVWRLDKATVLVPDAPAGAPHRYPPSCVPNCAPLSDTVFLVQVTV